MTKITITEKELKVIKQFNKLIVKMCERARLDTSEYYKVARDIMEDILYESPFDSGFSKKVKYFLTKKRVNFLKKYKVISENIITQINKDMGFGEFFEQTQKFLNGESDKIGIYKVEVEKMKERKVIVLAGKEFDTIIDVLRLANKLTDIDNEIIDTSEALDYLCDFIVDYQFYKDLNSCKLNDCCVEIEEED